MRASNCPHAPSFAAKISASALGNPIVTGSIGFPKVEGKTKGYLFSVFDYQADIEIEKLSDRGRHQTSLVSVPVTTPVPVITPGNNPWLVGGVIAGGLLVTAAGAGIADDVPSFALAASMPTRGWAMVRNGRLAVTLTGATAITASPAMAHNQ